MSDLDDSYSPPSATVTGDVTVAVVIILFMLFAVAFILYLRSKGYSGTMGLSRSQSRRLGFSPDQPNLLKQALDPSILKSLPIMVFRSEDFKNTGVVECAVCLSELSDGENARFLPKCRHGFHVECIDMWFQSNSTCPLCRNLVGNDGNIKPFLEIPVQPLEVVSETGNSAESEKLSLDEGSSSVGGSFSERRQKGMLVIEIPRREGEVFSSSSNTPLSSCRMPVEGIKSPALDRFRSLRRILSRGSLNSNCVGSPCSYRDYDIEQGIAVGSAMTIQKSSEAASYS